MNKNAYARLEKLAAKCSETLKGNRNYFDIFRGDMWAIIGAHHDISKARARKLSEKQLQSSDKRRVRAEGVA